MLPVSLAFIAAALVWSSLKYKIVFEKDNRTLQQVGWSIVVILPIGISLATVFWYTDSTVYLVRRHQRFQKSFCH